MVSGLTTVVVTMFLKIYSETSDYRPITIYRPQCPHGYCALGDYAQRTNPEEANHGVTLCLKNDNKSGLVTSPTGYKQVWSSEGAPYSGEDDEDRGSADGSGSADAASASSTPQRANIVAFWRPVPPNNQFVAMGDVVTTSYEHPPKEAVCVVHNSLVVSAVRGRRIWLEHSGAVSVWALARSLRYLDVRTFVSNDAREEPSAIHFRSLLPEVLSPPPQGNLIRKIIRGRDLNLLYRDHGSEAYEDLSIYVPQPPIRYSALGHYAERGYEKSDTAHVMVVREVGSSTILSHPVKYKKMWDSKGTGTKTEMAFWRPIPAPGYHCMGDVAAVESSEPPSTNSIVCLHWSVLQRGGRGWRIWWNRVTPTKRCRQPQKDLTAWRVGGKLDCESPNTFVVHPGFVTPPSERLLFHCLQKTALDI